MYSLPICVIIELFVSHFDLPGYFLCHVVVVISGLNLYCAGTNMSAIFNDTLLPFQHPGDIHALDPNCTASTFVNGLAIITIGYHECNTVMEVSVIRLN